MFTGLVEAKGVLLRRSRRGPGYRLTVGTSLGPLELGESISVSGACLTVVSADGSHFEADVSLETSEKTTLGALALGSLLNLERSLVLGGRLGGHLVSGHVDGVGELVRLSDAGEARRLSVTYPPELARFVAVKGSVALDGVSLTVNAVSGSALEVMVIPHTLSVTSLGGLTVGARLNVEVDTLARYAVRFLEIGALGQAPPPAAASSERALDREGRLAATLGRAGYELGSGFGGREP